MKFLYFCICFALLAGVAFAKPSINEELEKNAEICTEQSHVTTEELDKFFANGMQDVDATDPVKCHFKCIMEQNKFFVDGSLVPEEILKSLEGKELLKDRLDEMATVIATCNNEKGEHDCEGAYKLLKCIDNTEVGKMAFAA
ncbi:general odorant-binding protein 56h-like [Musca autumnalis]|uniref:general odorant-binding protein 56h-like n=1 Tax=Musca autumnalis TaxID=221902 RepID=UPI003CFA3E0E